MQSDVRPIDYKYLVMAEKRRVRHVQLTLDQARRPMGHGGWRPGAGRPRTRKGVSHDAREPVPPSHPQHATFRTVEGVPSLRQRKVVAVIRAAISKAHRADFRVIEFNVEPNHIHLVIEADGNAARARGMKGLKVRIARAVNRAFSRKGQLFEDRYHSRGLATPREVRHALRYVLNNAQHHGVKPSAADDSWIDPCSSAPWFDGWAEPIKPDTWWKRELLAESCPVARATVWLLRTGWRRHGLIAFDEAPSSR
jgi:REP-associated tyrosine transposase